MRDRLAGYQPPVEKGKEAEPNKRGTITSWNAEDGYGFIAINGKKVFCHATDLCAHVRPAKGKEPKITNVVVGSIEKTDKGFAAHSVECEDCARPTVWEIVPTQERIGTIYKYSIESPKKGAIPTPPEIIEKLKQANAAYEQAREKQILWHSSYTAGLLFKNFGKPDAVKFNAETNEMVVTYNDRGEKSFKGSAFLDNEVYAERFTGRIDQSGDAIEVEVAFDEIPGALMRARAISASIPGIPYREYYFKKMPPEVQRQVLELAREQIKSPAEIAKNQLHKHLTEDRYTTEPWEKINTLITEVQYPGELFLTTRSETTTVTFGESDDGYRAGGSYEELINVQYLVVGARQTEPYPRRVDEYMGGKSFFVSRASRRDEVLFPAATPPEEVRTFVLNKLRNQRDDLLGSVRKKAEGFSPNDKELFGMSRQEWLEHYYQAWDAAQKELLEEVEKQQAAEIKQKRLEWDTYSTTVEQIKKCRSEQYELRALAKKCRVDLQTSMGEAAHRSNLGADTQDQLTRELQALTAWLPAAKQELNGVVASRGEVLFATSTEREKALAEKALPARWFLHGISEEKIKEYGRAPGEGFGLKDAITGTYLPGKRAVIGILFESSRKGVEQYTYTHVSPVTRLPETGSYRHDTEVIGLAEDADWRILVVTTYNGDPGRYRLINERGDAAYLPQDDGDFLFNSKNWEGADGAGPTLEELLAAHNLQKNERKNWSVQSAAHHSTVENVTKAVPPAPSMPGVFGSMFAKALVKETPPPSVAEVAPRIDTSRRTIPEKALTPERLAVLYDECRVKRSYLRALILGIPNHKDWREKKSDLLTLLSVTEHEAPTFSSRTEYDKIMGKLSEVERRCSKLLASAEYKSSASKISNPHWAKDVQEIWKSIPDQIVTEVGELISVANQAAVRDAVYARAGEIVEQLQQGKQPDIKKMIDDAAEQYL